MMYPALITDWCCFTGCNFQWCQTYKVSFSISS